MSVQASGTNEAPRHFGRFTIEKELGHGGMGSVYAAYDPDLDRRVALKTMHRALDGGQRRARFRREAKLLSRATHQAIPAIYDIGETQSDLWITMQLIEGPALKDRLRERGPMRPEECVLMIEQVAAALAATHAVNVIHRDIKPANIVLSDSGRPFLVDFGIARSPDETTLTASDQVMGTAAYLAPECCLGQPATEASDVYGLACVAWEALTGQRVFPADSIPRAMHRHVTDPIPDLPAELKLFEPAFQAALAKSPGERTVHPERFAGALREAQAAAERASITTAPSPSLDADEATSQAAAAPSGTAAGNIDASSARAGEADSPTKPRRPWRLALVLVAAVALGWWWIMHDNPRLTVLANEDVDGMAASDKYQWTLDADELQRRSLTTGEPVGDPIEVCCEAAAVAAHRGTVWVVSRDGDKAFGLGLADDPQRRWVRSTVLRFDEESGRRLGRPTVVGRGASAIAVTDEAAWVANSAEGTVTRLDPQTGRRLGTSDRVTSGPASPNRSHDPPGPSKLVATGEEAWFLDNDEIKRLEGNPPEVDDTINVERETGGSYYADLAMGADRLWLAVGPLLAVYEIHPQSGQTLNTIRLPDSTPGSGFDRSVLYLTYGDDALWATDTRQGILTRITPNGEIRSLDLTPDAHEDDEKGAGPAVASEGSVFASRDGQEEDSRELVLMRRSGNL